MKVGSRGDYGLRALIYLAAQESLEKPVQIASIAERQQIPEDYLRQLLVTLRTAGLVKSVRGPHGGYFLAKVPGDISMLDVIEVLEGPPDHMRCRHAEEGMPPCSLIAGCQMRAQWHQATDALRETLGKTTLAELVRDVEL